MTLGARQWAVLVVCMGMWAVGVKGQADGSFWWLDNTTPSPTPSPDPAAAPSVSSRIKANCQCVPFYQCVDGVINTSGVGIIDIRGNIGNTSKPVTNVENCPQLLDICCSLPDDVDGSGSPGVTPPTGTTTTLPPDTPCTCVPLLECNDPNRLVSDGKGNTSLALFDSSVSHSKCRGAFEVCCAEEPTAMPQEEECICVPPELCGSDGHVITDGSGLLNPRFGPGGSPAAPLPSGFCRDRQDVCCLPPPPTTTQPPAPSHASCGWRNVGGVRVRILGFTEGESQFGEFPWVAAILKPTFTPSPTSEASPALEFVGGGTLIHPRVILTAAHKVYRESLDDLVVRVGEWDTQGETEPYPHQDIKVKNIVIHENFNTATLFNDVALLLLAEEAQLAAHVNTICLAEHASQVDWRGCVTNGWGVDSFGTTRYQEIMKSVTLPLVDSGVCQNNLRTTRLGRFFRLHPTFLCAGGEAGKDACEGDGGGPLACPRLDGPEGHYLLVGLTAWGVGCGREGLPGVYVNIPAMYPWITATIDQYLGTSGGLSVIQVGGNEAVNGGGRGNGRNQAGREERQRERERQREERRRLRQQMRQERRQNRNGRVE